MTAGTSIRRRRHRKVFECTSCGLSFMTAVPFLAHGMKAHTEEEKFSDSATSSNSTSFHTAVGSSGEEWQ